MSLNVMAVGAHPDDIEFGCGGTLINHKNNGDKVIYVCMTDTQSVDKTTEKIIRSHEQLKKKLSVQQRFLVLMKYIIYHFKI